MTQTSIKVDEILANPLFRNGVHLVGTLILGYLLLRLVLFFLDATHIGLKWLETHQGGGLLIIFVILVFSILAIDVAISQGRRRFIDDEKYSIAETGISYIKEWTKSPEEKSHLIKQENSMSKQEIDSLSEMTGTLKMPLQKQTVTKEVTAPSPVAARSEESIAAPAIPKAEEFVRLGDILKEHRQAADTTSSGTEPSGMAEQVITEKPRVKSEIKPKESVIPPSIPRAEEPVRLGDVLKKYHKLDEEPHTNIVLADTVPVLVEEGKRVIKSFESEHSISVIDFRSKAAKEDVEIRVELLKRSSRLATPIKEKNKIVYEFDNIWVDLSNDLIENAVVRFKVKREWINTNKILTIQFQQFIDGNWTLVSTKRIGQDTNNLFYEGHVLSFSCPFAIVGTSLGT